MAARPWFEAVAQAHSVGKDERDVRSCGFCGNHYVCAMCDNHENCVLAPQLTPPSSHIGWATDLHDPVKNAKLAVGLIERYGPHPWRGWHGTRYPVVNELVDIRKPPWYAAIFRIDEPSCRKCGMTMESLTISQIWKCPNPVCGHIGSKMQMAQKPRLWRWLGL